MTTPALTPNAVSSPRAGRAARALPLRSLMSLLDAAGGLRRHGAGTDRVRLARVSLDPIRALLGDKMALPIPGDDPREPDAPKAFSVAALRDGGYRYVILATGAGGTVPSLMAGSVIVRALPGALGVRRVCVVAAGLILFSFPTRRLRRLAATMEGFQASGFGTAASDAC